MSTCPLSKRSQSSHIRWISRSRDCGGGVGKEYCCCQIFMQWFDSQHTAMCDSFAHHTRLGALRIGKDCVDNATRLGRPEHIIGPLGSKHELLPPCLIVYFIGSKRELLPPSRIGYCSSGPTKIAVPLVGKGHKVWRISDCQNAHIFDPIFIGEDLLT